MSCTQMTIWDFCESNARYVRKISYEETKPFILGIHYARRMPCITDAFGLFVNGELTGVVTYGVPASPNLCKGLAGEKNKSRVRELNRLVLLPDKQNKNDASYLVGHSLKLMQNIYIYIYRVICRLWRLGTCRVRVSSDKFFVYRNDKSQD